MFSKTCNLPELLLSIIDLLTITESFHKNNDLIVCELSKKTTQQGAPNGLGMRATDFPTPVPAHIDTTNNRHFSIFCNQLFINMAVGW
jgi:hypothetical protein